jgi:hypothetical protein
MNNRRPGRTEILRVTNEHSRQFFLCLEPLGEQVAMEPHVAYEIVTSGDDAGVVEMILQDDKVIVYGWNGSDSVVFRDGKRVAGIDPPER